MDKNNLPKIDLPEGEYNEFYAPRYTTFDITKNCDISMEKLRDNLLRGFIEPSEKSPGQGKKALFSKIDIYAIELFITMVAKGFSRKLASKLSRKYVGVDTPLKIADYVAFLTIIQNGEETINTAYFIGSDEAQIDIAPFLRQDGFKDMIIVNLFDIRMKVDRALADV